MSTTEQHQATIGRVLRYFSKQSSSDLSFGRRASSVLLLDAFFHIMNIPANAFFTAPASNDWHAILVEHRWSPHVLAFLLSNGIAPSFSGASEREHECFQCAMQNLLSGSLQESALFP